MKVQLPNKIYMWPYVPPGIHCISNTSNKSILTKAIITFPGQDLYNFIRIKQLNENYFRVPTYFGTSVKYFLHNVFTLHKIPSFPDVHAIAYLAQAELVWQHLSHPPYLSCTDTPAAQCSLLPMMYKHRHFTPRCNAVLI